MTNNELQKQLITELVRTHQQPQQPFNNLTEKHKKDIETVQQVKRIAKKFNIKGV